MNGWRRNHFVIKDDGKWCADIVSGIITKLARACDVEAEINRRPPVLVKSWLCVGEFFTCDDRCPLKDVKGACFV